MKWQIKSYGVLDSTNQEAKRLIQAAQLDDVLHGLVLTAEQQTNGKGRLGRTWVSPAGTGLWMTAIINAHLPLEQTSLYSFAAAVSVAEAIRQMTGLMAQLKWPNDVLIENKKVSGILLELVPRTATEYYIVIGIGINVNQQKSEFSIELQEKATSLATLSGQQEDRAELLDTVLKKLDENCALLETEGFAPLRDKWLSLSCMIGSEVSVQQQGKTLYNGIAENLAMDGTLLVRTDDGLITVLTGDVSLRSKNGEYSFGYM